MKLSVKIGWTVCIIVCLALLATVCATVYHLPVASADPEPRLVIFDGDEQCQQGNKNSPYAYEYSSYVYTFVYRKGMDLKLSTQTADGTPIAFNEGTLSTDGAFWRPTGGMRNVKRDDNGVTYYNVSGRINNVTYTFKIYIEALELAITEWSGMSCEYGETPAPQVTLERSVTEQPTFYVERQVGPDSFYDQTLSANYIKDNVYGPKALHIKAILPATSNYVIAEASAYADYTVSICTKFIEVANPEPDAVTYSGEDYNAFELFGVAVPEGYRAKCNYRLSGIEHTDQYLLRTAGTYTVWFVFEGEEACFAHYSTAEYTFTIQRADVHFAVYDDSDVVLSYSNTLTRANLDYAAYKALLGKSYDLLDGEGNRVQCAQGNFEYTYFDRTDAGEAGDEYAGDTFPATVGIYLVHVHFSANTDIGANYNPTAPENDITIPLVITKATVVLEFYGVAEEMDYGTHFDLSHNYAAFNDDAFNAWAEAHPEDVHYTLQYKVKRNGEWVDYTPDEAVPMPGNYRAHVSMDSTLYEGVSSPDAYFTVNHVAIAGAAVDFVHAYVYGTRVNVEPVVTQLPIADVAPAETSSWQWTLSANGTSVALNENGTLGVGQYDVSLTLVGDPMYSCSLVVANGLTVSPKPITVEVWDYHVTYGERASLTPVKAGADNGENLVYWESGVVVAEDKAAFLQGLTVTVANADGEQVNKVDSTFVCRVSGYPITITSSADDYEVEFVPHNGGATPNLYIEKRALRVGFTSPSAFVVYEGGTLRVGISVENYVGGDAEYAVLANLFSLSYVDEQGSPVETPTEVGVYTLKVDFDAHAAALANYRVVLASQKLTIKSTTLPTTLDEFGVSGKFDGSEELVVTKGTASHYNSAASAVLSGYHVEVAYELSNAPDSNAPVTFSITAPKGLREPKILYLDSGNTWRELDYRLEGGEFVFTQTDISTTYLICAKTQINWLLIGLIAGGVGLAVVAVVVIVVVRKAKHNRAIAAAATKQVAAPTAHATDKPDEEEELDSFIEAFDESTVERELTPAERIALREKEEKYAQYKARLARMRTSDRTLNDTLGSLGLDKSADDEEIIRRMIEADEARARQVEEDLRREEEEARRREEEEKKAVILERSDEVLEQKTFAPTTPDTDDDDDIDI